MNKQIENIAGITYEEYKKYCKENNKHFSKTSTKKEFFKELIEGKIYRNNEGKITRKN